MFKWELLFVATKESTVHDNYKAKIVKAKDIDTKVTGRSTGHPVRNLRNKQTNTYLKLEAEGAGLEQLENLRLEVCEKQLWTEM